MACTSTMNTVPSRSPILKRDTGASRHDDTQRKTQRQSNAQGDQSQLQRDGDLLGNDLGNGDALPVDVGFSQISVQHLLIKAQQLGGQGSGHAEGLELDLNLGGTHFIVILKISLHGHQPQKGEENCDNDKHSDEGAQNALGDISGHMMSSWVFLPSYDFRIIHPRGWPPRAAGNVWTFFSAAMPQVVWETACQNGFPPFWPKTGIRADTAAAFAVAAPVQAPKNCLWSNTVYMRL